MILYDGIIFSLQRSGGISVLYKELLDRLALHPEIRYSIQMYGNISGHQFEKSIDLRSRVLERYRGVLGVGHGVEVFHSTYYRLPQSRCKKSKVVTTVHDYTYERYFSGARKWLHSWQKNSSVKQSDKIICVSRSTRQDLLEYTKGVSEDRVAVVYNGVSHEYFPLPEIGTSEQVLFVGARSGYKNFESVVRALADLKDLSLVCVGGGSFSNSERELLESNIPNRYRHAGFLSNVQLNDEYNKSLCLVYPSLYEGFGIPVLESMRAGCPVIAVNCSSIPEVAGSAAILMENGDVEEIKAAITYVMVNENRRDLVEKGLRQSRNFDWDKNFNETISIYEEVLGKTLLVEK